MVRQPPQLVGSDPLILEGLRHPKASARLAEYCHLLHELEPSTCLAIRNSRLSEEVTKDAPLWISTARPSVQSASTSAAAVSASSLSACLAYFLNLSVEHLRSDKVGLMEPRHVDSAQSRAYDLAMRRSLSTMARLTPLSRIGSPEDGSVTILPHATQRGAVESGLRVAVPRARRASLPRNSRHLPISSGSGSSLLPQKVR